MLESYDKAENFIKDGSSLLSVCSNTSLTPSLITFPFSITPQTFTPVNPGLGWNGVSTNNSSVTPIFTGGCGEILLINITDADGTDCHIRLDIPAGRFYDFTALSNSAAGANNTFTFTGDYNQGGSGYQTTVTGTSDCMGGCMYPAIALCDKPLLEGIFIEDDCKQHLLDLAYHHALIAYEEQIKALTDQFKEDYIAHCINPDNFTEVYEMEYPDNQYQVTLYYYNPVGNLVQTVPPAGVTKLTASEIATAANLRKIGSATVMTPVGQSKQTTYEYNSLNQLVSQTTPDGGESNFWYDGLGRLVVSQNDEQNNDDWYSYMLHDGLGRVIEAGEILKPGSPMSQTISMDHLALMNWLGVDPNDPTVPISNPPTKRERTITQYDEPLNATISAEFTNGQQNLRNRVASIIYIYDDTDPDGYTAYYHSYDIHGNVKEMIQEFPFLDPTQRFKHFRYDYDLISGNINELIFQEGEKDELRHRYEYDADNRIKKVETSTDGLVWQTDAKYEYYPHGPVSRVELGDQQVQGMDYAYTIQGWIKGINSNSLDPDRDMGHDGTLGLNPDFTQDAFGYTLGYFENDYQAIGSGLDFEADPTEIYSFGSAKSLFNGNINHMTVSLPGMNDQTTNEMTQLEKSAYVFEYDQLHRIKQMRAFTDAHMATSNNWNSMLSNGDHDTDYSFDEDGNLMTLKRKGSLNSSSGLQPMDDLTYAYQPGTNRLRHVKDLVPASNYANDVDEQDDDNYDYDDIGNLIKDEEAEISDIEWTISGKIRKIIRIAGSTKPGLEFIYDPMG